MHSRLSQFSSIGRFRSKCGFFRSVLKMSVGFAVLWMAAIPTRTLAVPCSNGQQQTTPGLHSRSEASAGAPMERNPGNAGAQVSTLPRDISGAYEFDHLNESIEVDVTRNKLSGYISRLGDAETDSDTPLTYFFDRSSIEGSQLQFQTRVVHGIWYSFRGTIVRGSGATRKDEGYYVLHGVLQEHHPQDQDEKSANETVLRRTVNFKSLAQ